MNSTKNKFQSWILNSIWILTVWTALVGGCKKGNGGDEDDGQNPPPNPPVTSDVSLYLTQSDQSVKFKKQNVSLLFSNASNGNATIDVDTTQTYQTIDGFGYALTGGSATLLNALSPAVQDPLLKELFLWD